MILIFYGGETCFDVLHMVNMEIYLTNASYFKVSRIKNGDILVRLTNY